MLLLDPHLFRTMLTVMLPPGFTVMAPCGDCGDPVLCVSSTLLPPSSGALQPPAAPNANHPATFTCINTPSSHEINSEAGPHVLPETQEATPCSVCSLSQQDQHRPRKLTAFPANQSLMPLSTKNQNTGSANKLGPK